MQLHDIWGTLLSVPGTAAFMSLLLLLLSPSMVFLAGSASSLPEGLLVAQSLLAAKLAWQLCALKSTLIRSMMCRHASGGQGHVCAHVEPHCGRC